MIDIMPTNGDEMILLEAGSIYTATTFYQGQVRLKKPTRMLCFSNCSMLLVMHVKCRIYLYIFFITVDMQYIVLFADAC